MTGKLPGVEYQNSGEWFWTTHSLSKQTSKSLVTIQYYLWYINAVISLALKVNMHDQHSQEPAQRLPDKVVDLSFDPQDD